MYLIPIIGILAYVSETSGHSWIACADYTEKNGRYWDPDKCRGFARDSERFARKSSFGTDAGNFLLIIEIFRYNLFIFILLSK